MPSLTSTHFQQAETEKTEILLEVIAGPETAAQLGVPVGTVVDARHVVPSGEKQVSPSAAAVIRERIFPTNKD